MIFKIRFLPTFLFLIFLTVFQQGKAAPDPGLKVLYLFNKMGQTDSVRDETGNGYNGFLNAGAIVRPLGAYNVLSTGTTNGFLNLGASLGNLIQGLGDFTVSTCLYIDPSLALANNGNFVWSFSNSQDISSNASGCMFYTAKNSRYAICSTNWSTEKSVSVGTASVQGKWTHIAYVQSGTTGTVYINGVAVQSKTVTQLPSSLGTPAYNYLAKSAYASDQYLKNSLYYDFRMYNKALSADQVAALTSPLSSLDTLIYKENATLAAASITLGDVSALTTNLTLPASATNNASVTWSTTNASVITSAGIITRPAYGKDTATAVLTASVTVGFETVKRDFTVKVAPYLSDAARAQADADSIKLSNAESLHSNLVLPATGLQGCSISWQSSQPTVLSNAGVLLARPSKGSGGVHLYMTAKVTSGTTVVSRDIPVFVAEEEAFSAYLFAYFTGNNISQEAIRFATSSDGYVYNALNSGNPVIASSVISSTGGVRDPHILRGVDGKTYYMVATDMVSANGWNSNRAMVLLKSANLTDWTSTVINIPNTYSQYAAADRIWAPQTIYDPAAGKYMVYFSMRLGSGDFDKIYYAYVNSSFTALETAPKLLFNNNGLSTIDGDIVYKDGQYHLFFKTEGNGNGIKKAVSSSLTSGYKLVDKYLQSTSVAVEGGCVFRRYNTDDWILIYDMYTSGAYQFTKSTDLLNFSVVSNTVTFDFTPRHGTIIPITAAELYALNVKWNPSAALNTPSTGLTCTLTTDDSGSALRVRFGTQPANPIRLEIIDLTGHCLQSSSTIGIQTSLDIARLQPGLYFLRYTTAGQAPRTERFLVR